MSDRRLDHAVRQIRRFARPPVNPADDRALLAAFATSRDETAFAELVRRHGPLVLGVCRRVLGDVHAAEDVFQATFLTLARKAGTVRWHAAVGPWLYAVASRLARKVRANRRRQPPGPFLAGPNPAADAAGSPDPAVAAAWAELRQILDDELARLPDRLRSPLVLCYLDGRTRDEAAAAFGWSLATLKRRLERGRSLLRKRSEARGLSAGLLAAAVELVPVSPDLRATTLSAVTLFAVDGTIAGPVAMLLGGSTVSGARVTLALGTLMLAGVVGLVASRERERPEDSPKQKTPIAHAPGSPEVRRDQFGDPLPRGAIARFGTIKLRQSSSIQGVGFLPGGKTLISWGWDGVRVWDLATGTEIRHFAPRPSTVPMGIRAASLSWDRSTVAAVYDDAKNDKRRGNVELWDVASGKCVRWFSIPRCSTWPVFSPDGKTLALVGEGAEGDDDRYAVLLYDVATGHESGRLKGFPISPSEFLFTPDGRQALVGGYEPGVWPPRGASLQLWDVGSDREIRRFALPAGLAGAVLSPDGRILATTDRSAIPVPPGAEEGERPGQSPIRLWDVGTGKELRVLPSKRGSMSYTFSSDGKRLWSADNDGGLIEREVATGKALRTLRHVNTGPFDLSFDGRAIATTYGQSIQIRSTAYGVESKPVAAPDGTPHCVVASPTADVVASTDSMNVYIWEAKTGAQIGRLDSRDGRLFTHLSWLPDGKSLIATKDEMPVGTSRLRVWDAELKREREPPARLAHLESTVCPLSGGKLMVVCGKNWPRTQPDSICDIATGRELFQLGSNGVPQAVSQDGRAIYGRDGNAAVSWDAATGKELRRLMPWDAGEFAGLQIAPDGRRFAIHGYRTPLLLFDMSTGKELRRFDHPDGDVGATAFSPDGLCLAAGGSSDGSIAVWEVASGKQLHHFEGHRGRIDALTFTPDGKRLISGSSDTTVIVWELSGPPPARP